MESNLTEIKINGIDYVRKDSVNHKAAENWKGLPYVIVRTYSAGVFAGYFEKRNGKEGTIRNVRRIWHWEGAATLSQLAMEGTSKPNGCKFPRAVDCIELTEIIEVLHCTETARLSIQEVSIWKE